MKSKLSDFSSRCSIWLHLVPPTVVAPYGDGWTLRLRADIGMTFKLPGLSYCMSMKQYHLAMNNTHLFGLSQPICIISKWLNAVPEELGDAAAFPSKKFLGKID